MKHVYPKDGRLYLRVKVAGKWRGLPTDFKPGQERQARSLLDDLLTKMSQGMAITGQLGPLTVAQWGPPWLEKRKAPRPDGRPKIATWRNDESVLRIHVYPSIGTMKLEDVLPMHLDRLVESLRNKLSGKSIHNVYGTLSAMFRDARIANVLSGPTPCILTKAQLGEKDSEELRRWRRTAQFTRDELEALISDERIPMDRRVLYAVLGIAGLRHGEASKMPWSDCGVQPEPEPLGMMWVMGKGGLDRPVPIHPTLAAMLAEWRMYGWGKMMGRKPTPEDLVFPMPPDFSRPGGKREKWNTRDGLEKDLAVLGFRHRRTHDLRRTMISLARSDGANKDILRRVTHKPPKEVIEDYTTYEWDVVCREVVKFKIQRRQTGKVYSLPKAVGSEFLATPSATHGSQRMEFVTRNAEPTPGLEPGGHGAYHSRTSLSKKQLDLHPQGYAKGHPEKGGKQAGKALDARSTVAAALLEAREAWIASGDSGALRESLKAILSGLDGES